MTEEKKKPLLCLDFDGVIHEYKTPWTDAKTISDGPVPGALTFISLAMDHFVIAIYSSRSSDTDGWHAMQSWLRRHWLTQGYHISDFFKILWPTSKPPAFLTIDDRVLLFEGQWPDIEALKAFKPWNKR